MYTGWNGKLLLIFYHKKYIFGLGNLEIPLHCRTLCKLCPLSCFSWIVWCLLLRTELSKGAVFPDTLVRTFAIGITHSSMPFPLGATICFPFPTCSAPSPPTPCQKPWQGCQGQKSQRKTFFKVKEKLENFASSQGNLKLVKSQGILFSGCHKLWLIFLWTKGNIH